MKKMRKLLGIVMAAAMALTLVIPAAADDTYGYGTDGKSTTTPGDYTITIKGPKDENDAYTDAVSGHTYEAYQIFAGTLSDDGKTLSNVKWGDGVKGDEIIATLTTEDYPIDALKDCQTPAAVAEALAKNPEVVKAFAKIVGAHLSENIAGTSKYNENQTPKNYTIENLNPGYYLVKDKDKSVPAGNDSYTDFIIEVVSNSTVVPKSDLPEVEKKADGKDEVDHAIDEKVNFTLTGTLPENYSSYETYKYIFHDTMSIGLTYNNDAKVYIVNGESRVEVTNQFAPHIVPGNRTETRLYIGCDDITEITMGDDNVTTVIINKDTQIVVEYSATVNELAMIGHEGNLNKVNVEYSNNPNGDGEGTTPEDEVKVYTFKLIVNKVTKGEDGNVALAGADFELKKWDGEDWDLVNYEGDNSNNDMTVFNYKGLDEGIYWLHESETPDGYNTIEDIYFKLVPQYTDGKLTGLTVKLLEKGLTNIPTSWVEKTDADTGFDVIEGPDGTTTDIVNNSGAELPETGGMGTTIFTVGGAGLMVLAVVLLVTKKKMSNR